MKKSINYILVLFLFCACANAHELQAQDEKNNRVIVHLAKGSQFEAELIEWNQETDVMVFEAFGSQLTFKASEVKKIIHVGMNNQPVYNFKETGPYYHVRMNLITGNPGNRSNRQPGIGLSVAAGKRFNRFLSLGAGVGFDEYIVGTSENILSTFGEVSGYFFPTNQSFSYNVAAGYGFAFKNEDANLNEATGGFMIHPSLGLRLGKRKLKWTIDLGYKFQKANWVYDNWGTRSDQRILYRRMTIRTGILF